MSNEALKFFGEDNTANKLLKFAVKAGISMSVTGTTGEGKTTLLRELVDSVPASETIAVIESFPEMKLHKAYPDRNIIEFHDKHLNTDEVIQSIRAANANLVIIGKVPNADLLRYLASMAGLPVLLFEYSTASETGIIQGVPQALLDSNLVESIASGENVLAQAVRLSVHVKKDTSNTYLISHINEIVQKINVESNSLVGRNVVAYMYQESRHIGTSCLSPYLDERILNTLSVEDVEKFREFVDEEWGR
jgi:Flp pilus assembly CpaF family ATPase